MEREGGIGVVEVSDPHVVDGLGIVQLLEVGVIRQPGFVPVIDPVEVRRVVQSVVACKGGEKGRGNMNRMLGTKSVTYFAHPWELRPNPS